MVDVAIIGAGPIGIEVAIALKTQGISYVHFDKGQVGQMIYNFPPLTRFFSSSERISIAGIPIQTIDQQKCTREEYLGYLRSVVTHFGLEVNSFEDVVSINRSGGRFEIVTQSNRGKGKYSVAYLVLATGGTSHSRLLNVPGEDLPHVSTKMVDPHLYFQKHVLVVGGKNSAAESVLRCFHAGAKVSLAVRAPELTTDKVKYWILPELLGYIKTGEIKCYYDAEIGEITSSAVKLRHGPDKHDVIIDADFVIKAIGFEMDPFLFRQAGVSLSSKNIPSYNPDTMETDVENVWIVGTAVGGTQKKFAVFIENCHEHAYKVARAICSKMGRDCIVPCPSMYRIVSELPEA